MNSENSEADITKRARFEAKFLRKRFPFRTGTARRQDRCLDNREKSDQNPATATTRAAATQECESGASEGKVDKRLDDAALERFVLSLDSPSSPAFTI